jgi:hypothetical protein
MWSCQSVYAALRLFALLVGVYITLGENLLGLLLVFGGGYELWKVLSRSDYSITLTGG